LSIRPSDNFGLLALPLLAQAAHAADDTGEGTGEGSGVFVPPSLSEQFFNDWHGTAVLTGIGVLMVAYAVYAVIRRAKAVSAYGLGLERDVRVQIKRRENEAQFVAAGDILFTHERYEEAAELYVRGQDELRAGEALEKAGQLSKAAQHYKRGGAPMMAAEAYLRRNQFQLAAKEFMAAEAFDRAAEAFVRAHDYRRAAELFRQQDRLLEAGKSYEKLGNRSSAAEMYIAHFDRQLDLARGDLREIKDACAVAERAAGFMAEDGKVVEAADLLKKAGYRKRAAEIYAEVGEIDRAAQIYVEANRPLQAAKLYESVGDRKQALRYRAEARLLSGDKSLAAEDFADAGDFIRAAELFSDVEDLERAAHMYEQAGDVRMAAELFNLVGKERQAAEAYQKAGDYAQAAELYREMGDFQAELQAAKAGNNFFRVGEILLEHGRMEDALAAFQRVESIDGEFERANILQGDILRQLGRLDVAFNKYKVALGEGEPSKANVDILYKMALAAEEAGVSDQALQLFESVIGVDYYYRDAAGRASALREGGASGNRGSMIGEPNQGRTAQSSPDQLPAKEEVLRYDVIDEIARGGMGVVFRARDTVLDRIVAYKILSANLKTNKVAVKYFLREAQAAAKMSHPNIVTVYDAGEQAGEYYMAMEYVEGQTLKALVSRQGAFPEKLVRYILVHVCRGLAYAHERGLVHRDVKPGNLMLTMEKTVKLMDFGLAKFVEEIQANHTRAIGTPYYMSPEQILGKDLDGRSDLYSLGISMYECATGKVPFSKGDLSYHHLNTVATPVHEMNPKISRELSDIIAKCMEKSADDRFATSSDLLASVK
jgi:tetratricopeptide (TPR) repeat protein